MNKPALLALSLLVVLTASPARADGAYLADPQQRNLLLVNPGDLLGGVISIEYERALASWFGLTAGFSAWAFRGVFAPLGEPSFTGISPEFGARLHFVRAAPGGLWIGPYVTAGYLFSRSDGALNRVWAWGVGGALGYNFIIGQNFTIQLGVGGGVTDFGDRLVWAPRLRLGLGVAF